MLKSIQPRTDGIKHNDKNNLLYFDHIDMATVPEELACIADKDYDLENMPIEIDSKIEKIGRIEFKKGDKCGINFNTMVYAMNEMIILQKDEIDVLKTRIDILEGS